MEEGGTVKFYKVKKTTGAADGQFIADGELLYYGKASLFAAIVAEDAAMYDCSMKKALEQLKIVASLHEGRAVALNDYYTTTAGADANCKSLSGDSTAGARTGAYGVAADAFGQLANLDTALGNPWFKGTQKTTISEQKLLLESYLKTVRAQSCPAVY
jgi:hypothetical protein